jgi:ELWxxDGT repeat protein
MRKITTLLVLVAILQVGYSQTIELFTDINTTGASNPSFFNKALGKLFFTANDGTGDALWVTDGTAANTIKLINQSAATIVEFNGKAYFTADDPTKGRELFVTDGTVAGTGLFFDFYEGTKNGSPIPVAVFDNHLYIVASDSLHGDEIWRTDGTAANTSLFLELVPGTSGSGAEEFHVLQNKLLFSAYTSTYGRELWYTDGGINADIILDMNPGNQSSTIEEFCEMNGKYYFSGEGELYVTDGTTAGTYMVKDVRPGAGLSRPYKLTQKGNQIIFGATDGTNICLWATDGTEAGTVQLKQYYNGPQKLTYLTTYNNEVYLCGRTDDSGSEPWHTDGTVPGTLMLVNTITTQGQGAGAADFTELGGKLFFRTSNTIYVSDGTLAGTQTLPFPAFATNAQVTLADMFEYNGAIYFTADYDNKGREIYKLTLPTTGVNNLGEAKALSVYPNPAANYVTVQNENNTPVQLLNTQGQIIGNYFSTNSIVTINTTEFANGLYFVKAGNAVTKVIVNK